PGHREYGTVTRAVIEQVTDAFEKTNAAHRAAEPDQSRHRAHGAFRNEIRRQRHHKRGPGLLSEIRDAEEHNHPRESDVRYEEHQRTYHSAGSKRNFARPVHGELPVDQPAG